VQKLRRGGVDLFYEEAAGGDPPVLLVHGWCWDHPYFAPPVRALCGTRQPGRRRGPAWSRPERQTRWELRDGSVRRRGAAPLGHEPFPRDVPRHPLRQDCGLGPLLPAGSSRAGRCHDRPLPHHRAERAVPISKSPPGQVQAEASPGTPTTNSTSSKAVRAS
jgi:hypothetical protein